MSDLVLRRGSLAVALVACFIVGACRGAAPDPEPSPQKPAAAVEPVAEKPPAEPPTGPRGMVRGVPWVLEHDDQGYRLEIGSGDERSSVVVTKGADGCYLSEQVHGSWCELEALATTLIENHPDIVKPR